jgi:hypothetical protein
MGRGSRSLGRVIFNNELRALGKLISHSRDMLGECV